MRAVLFLVAASLIFSSVSAQESPRERMLRETGGFVIKPGTQKGEVFYVNCQHVAEVEWIKESMAYISEITKFKTSYSEGVFDVTKPEIHGSITIFIIDDDKLPSLLCAPEIPWVAVNIAKLKIDKRQFFAARVKKELSRAFAVAAGAVNSQYKGTLMQPVTKVADLDHHVDYRLPADVVARCIPYSREFGLVGELKTTYLCACKEGWAAQPTNEYQKAIWDKVHEIPTEPITIKPESHPAK